MGVVWAVGVVWTVWAVLHQKSTDLLSITPLKKSIFSVQFHLTRGLDTFLSNALSGTILSLIWSIYLSRLSITSARFQSVVPWVTERQVQQVLSASSLENHLQ